MNTQKDEIDEFAEKLVQHLAQNTGETIRRATRILLLANSGGLALVLNSNALLCGKENFLITASAFALGILISGSGPVIDGILFAGVKGLRRNKEIMGKVTDVIANKMRSNLQKNTEDKPFNIDEINIEEAFPVDELRKQLPSKLSTIILAVVCFCTGVGWSFWTMFQTTC